MILAIDAGTSGGRAILFDAQGQALSEGFHPWRYLRPAEAAPWGRAFDPGELWGKTAAAARDALTAAGCAPAGVCAVAVTSQRQGIALLDGAGHTLYAGPNIDLRGVFQGAQLLEMHGEVIYQITGHLPPYLFAPARLLWFRDHQPDLYARVRTMLMLDGWLVHRLCGARVAEFASAAESGLFDVGARTWSQPLLAQVDVRVEILPPLVDAGSVVGTLSGDAAATLGLHAGTPVVIAGPDTQCGLLGMDVLRPGETGIVAGWSAPAQRVAGAPVFDPQQQLWATCHLLPPSPGSGDTGRPGGYILEGNAGPAGQVYTWLRNVLMPGATFEQLNDLAAQAPAGCTTLAYLGPRLADYGSPKLLWGGLLFPLVNDFDEVERPHLARAGLENIAFALKANLERMNECVSQQVSGPANQRPVPSPDESNRFLADPPIRLGGGLSRSALFAQVLSDVLGAPVWRSELPVVSGLGAAVCGAVGAGLYASLAEGATAMRPTGALHEPQRVVQAEYIDAYERWLGTYARLVELSEEMS